MAGRIIIKPFRIDGASGGNMETNGSAKFYFARPEFLYAGMPKSGKPAFGRGIYPWMAVVELAKYLPRDLREQLMERKPEDIYPRPDCEIQQEHLCIDMDGYKPTRDEWFLMKAYFNRDGNLSSYWHLKKEQEALAQP